MTNRGMTDNVAEQFIALRTIVALELQNKIESNKIIVCTVMTHSLLFVCVPV